MKRVFLDTNILLDALEASRPRHLQGKDILALAGNGMIEAVVSTQSLVDVAYIYTRGHKERLEQLKTLLLHFDNILTIRDTTRRSLMMATRHFSDDFEDATQAAVALDADCELIITADSAFDDPFGLPIVSPEAFCHTLFSE